MENKEKIRYLNHTQKDSCMSFKLQIVQEIEQGEFFATLLSSKI
jgi:hypothetical protein